MGEGFTADIGGFVLTDVDSAGVSWRTFNLDEFFKSTASTLSLVQKTRGPGGWLSPRQLTPRTLPINGVIDAPDRPSARDAIDRLNAAVSIDGARLTVTADDSTRWCDVYRQDEVLPTWVTDTSVTWSIQVSAPDPRKFSTDLNADTGLPSALGGLAIPFTIPFTIASTIVTGSCILTNPGNTTGPVRLRIDGPITGPVVTHVSTGLALVFASSLTLGVGEWLDVDMEAQTVLANGTASRNGWITNRGWSGFDPGSNIWSFSAASGSGLLTVYATPAWL